MNSISTSSFRTRLVTFTHTWTIDNYLSYVGSYDSVRSGFHLESEPFSFSPKLQQQYPDKLASIRYIVSLYPKSNVLANKDYTGIFTSLAPDSRAHTVFVEYSIIDGNGQERETRLISTSANTTNPMGVSKWILWEKLVDPQNGYLSHKGQLTIRIIVHRSVSDPLKVPAENESVLSRELESLGPKELCSNLADLWQMRQEYSDLGLIVSENQTELPAHKVILVARSPVFAAMFRDKTSTESLESIICIPDMSVEVCEAFLEYLYTGVVKSLEEQAENLLPFADKYQIDHLKSICEDFLCTQTTSETANHLLTLSTKHNANKLKEKSLNLIKKRALESITTLLETPNKAAKVDQMLTKLLKRTK